MSGHSPGGNEEEDDYSDDKPPLSLGVDAASHPDTVDDTPSPSRPGQDFNSPLLRGLASDFGLASTAALLLPTEFTLEPGFALPVASRPSTPLDDITAFLDGLISDDDTKPSATDAAGMQSATTTLPPNSMTNLLSEAQHNDPMLQEQEVTHMPSHSGKLLLIQPRPTETTAQASVPGSDDVLTQKKPPDKQTGTSRGSYKCRLCGRLKKDHPGGVCPKSVINEKSTLTVSTKELGKVDKDIKVDMRHAQRVVTVSEKEWQGIGDASGADQHIEGSSFSERVITVGSSAWLSGGDPSASHYGTDSKCPPLLASPPHSTTSVVHDSLNNEAQMQRREEFRQVWDATSNENTAINDAGTLMLTNQSHRLWNINSVGNEQQMETSNFVDFNTIIESDDDIEIYEA